MTNKKNDRAYEPPALDDWGSIAGVTATGLTIAGDDFFDGSIGGPCHPPGQTKDLPECQ